MSEILSILLLDEFSIKERFQILDSYGLILDLKSDNI